MGVKTRLIYGEESARKPSYEHPDRSNGKPNLPLDVGLSPEIAGSSK